VRHGDPPPRPDGGRRDPTRRRRRDRAGHIEADPPRSYYARGAKGSGKIFVLRRLAPREVVERRMSRVFGLER
jgi:hypothetical protein